MSVADDRELVDDFKRELVGLAIPFYGFMVKWIGIVKDELQKR